MKRLRHLFRSIGVKDALPFFGFLPGRFAPISAWLRERAAQDPLCAFAEGMHGHFVLLTTGSEESTKWLQEQLNAGRSAIPGVGLVEVYPEHKFLRVNLECTDAARSALDAIVTELLKSFPDYSIYDEDTDEEITQLVRADVGELFKIDGVR